MAKTTVNDSTTWTTVVTTTASTLFQNHGRSTFYITTDDTSGLAEGDGLRLASNEGVTISSGKTVSVRSTDGDAIVFYMEV